VAATLASLAMLHLQPVAATQCTIDEFPTVAVTMKDMQPLVWAKINGVPARFIIDTGSFWSMISPAARARFHLPAGPWLGVRLHGVNGSSAARIASVRTFEFLDVPFRRAKFLVGGNAYRSGAVGLLGGKLLRLQDLELDFARGRMRFVKARHCPGVPLAYWAQRLKEPIGVVRLRRTSSHHPYLIGHAAINGKRIRVLFDTGASRSVLTLRAARRAGITPSSPGVKWLGKFGGGIGKRWINSWIAPLATFRIGDEEIENTHILVSAIHMPGLSVGMILGDDFFLSHRVLVAYRRRRLYFTYNGGPIFDIGHRYVIQSGVSAPVLAGPGLSSKAASGHLRGESGAVRPARSLAGRRARAGALMRRGMAFAAEGEYGRASEYVSRACRLEPKDADFLLRRGTLYLERRQPAKALAEFTAAIKLQPDLYAAHLARAELLLEWKHAPRGSAGEARTDINMVSLLAPNESNAGLMVGNLYARIGHYAAAVRAVKLWIYYHRHDVMLPVAWNSLCRARAEGDIQLRRALRDCNRALARLPHSAEFLDSRGLVYLRLGQFARSITSYDAALAIAPKLATALYGRGLAELREQQDGAGRADIAAAVKIGPRVAQLFARMHLQPEGPRGGGQAAGAPYTSR